MVFDLLSQSLFDFFQEAKFAPFSIRQIQSFAQQLVNSIVFLHDLRYIHTDLKPENLMLVDKKKVDVPVQVCYQCSSLNSLHILFTCSLF